MNYIICTLRLLLSCDRLMLQGWHESVSSLSVPPASRLDPVALGAHHEKEHEEVDMKNFFFIYQFPD